MKVDGIPYRSIWLAEDGRRRPDHRPALAAARLPRRRRSTTAAEAAAAIRDMWVRGAPLIGATAAYGIALAMRGRPLRRGARRRLRAACIATRPTAVNLRWALDEMRAALSPLPPGGARRRGLCPRRRDLRRGRGDQRARSARTASR